MNRFMVAYGAANDVRTKSMLQLAWPWALAALPLPWLVRWLVPLGSESRRAALRIPFFHDALAWNEAALRSAPGIARLLLAVFAWCALVVAASRPQWTGDPVSLPITGRDLVLAIDLSGSMGEKDQFLRGQRVDRLGAVKEIAGDFLERRVGDRVGLILFGTRPYVQVPLTFDRAMARKLLEDATIGLAGGQTAIGDAIGLAVQLLRERPVQSRVLVLMTDGENTTGRIDPIDAARLAELHGLRIHAIGIGRGIAAGLLPEGLDERTLERAARITGGGYYRAENTDALESIYRVLDAIEPAADHEDLLRPALELFHWPLGVAYLAMVAAALGALLAGLGPGLRDTPQAQGDPGG